MPEVIKRIDFIIKINQRVAESVGPMYVEQLRSIFSDLLKVYGHYSTCISSSISTRQNQDMLKPMKLVRRDILRLIQIYIEKESQFQVFSEEFLPTLKALVDDFQNSDPNARDPEVLLLFATLFKRMGTHLAGFLQHILINLCDTTLTMIKDDYISFPEFRESFFTLVEKIVKHCTNGLFMLSMSQFRTFILTILFAMKHEKPEAMDIGLTTLHALNELVVEVPEIRTQFYQTFYIPILKDTLAVMTDYRHVAGFKLQGLILQQLIIIIQQDVVALKLNEDAGNPHGHPSNKEFVVAYLITCINQLFQNLNRVQIEAFVLNLFNNCLEWSTFKTTLRDLLISMKSFSSTDDEFYQEEKKAAEDQATLMETQRRAAIPGLNKEHLNPDTNGVTNHYK